MKSKGRIGIDRTRGGIYGNVNSRFGRRGKFSQKTKDQIAEIEADETKEGIEYSDSNQLTRERYSKTRGKTVSAVMATAALRKLVVFGDDNTKDPLMKNNRVMPICAWPSKSVFPVDMHEVFENRLNDSSFDKLERMVDTERITETGEAGGDSALGYVVTEGVEMCPILDSIHEDEVGVVVLTIGSGNEHAIIIFIHGSHVWSCGFGYAGESKHSDVLATNKNFNWMLKLIPNEMHNSTTKAVEEKVQHMFKGLQGAIYTSDWNIPKSDQEGNIVWVGFMDLGMKGRIKDYLKRVKAVEIQMKGEIRDDYGKPHDIFATNRMTLAVGEYQEGVGWYDISTRDGRMDTMNCIQWVNLILGKNLICGMLGRPSTCNSINQEQWDSLIESSWPQRTDNALDVVQQIQDKLLNKTVNSMVGATMRYLTRRPVEACVGGVVGGLCGPAAAGTCVGAGCGAVVGATVGHIRSSLHAPTSMEMTRDGGGRKTRRKRKKRRTRNKRKNKGRQTRNKRNKYRRKRRTF